MLNLLRLELLKIFSKWRTYIGFIAIGFLLPVLHAAMYFEGKEYIELATKTLADSFNFSGELLNAYMVTRIMLQGLYFQIPLLISLVGGDLLAGEATSGTYRLLLARPVSRLQVVSSKYLAGLIYTFLLIAFLALMSWGLGLLIFGPGDLLVVSSQITVIPEAEAPIRMLYSFLFAFLSMAVVYTISFFFSALVENSIGPIMSTMAIIIVFSIVNLISVGFLENIQTFLFTNHMQSWRYFFEEPIDWGEINASITALVLHLVILVSFTFYYFNKKDIHS